MIRTNSLRISAVVFGTLFLILFGAPDAFAGQTYTMQKGDTLWDLSAKYFGDPTLYKDFLEVNNISNPRTIPVGKVIVIPSLDEIKKVAREHDPAKKQELINKIVGGKSTGSDSSTSLLGGSSRSSSSSGAQSGKTDSTGIRRDGLKALFEDSVKPAAVKPVEAKKN